MAASRRRKRARSRITLSMFFERGNRIPTALFVLTWISFAVFMLLGSERWPHLASLITGSKGS